MFACSTKPTFSPVWVFGNSRGCHCERSEAIPVFEWWGLLQPYGLRNDTPCMVMIIRVIRENLWLKTVNCADPLLFENSCALD